LIILLVLLVPGLAQAGTLSPELSARMEALGPAGEIPVIITFSEKVDVTPLLPLERKTRRREIIGAMKGKAAEQQKGVRQFLSGKGRRAANIWIINALATRLTVDAIAAVSRFPEVDSLRPDAVIQAPAPLAAAAAQPEWNIAKVRAPELWALGFTGSGVVVATMDTGVDVFHPDLQARWRGGANSWFNPYAVDCTPCLSYDRDVCPIRISCSSCDLNGSDPCDLDGHGTQTMGILTGGDAGGTAIGVAPGSRWIAAKIFADPVGTGEPEASTSAIHQAFQWVLDPDGDPATDDAPDVLNNSWGLTAGNSCLAEFEPDVATLKAAGIAVVFAAGNDGPASASGGSPANYQQSFSVGAVDDTDTIAYSSSRGPSACTGSIFPSVTAPGVNIRTSDLTFGGVIPDAYATVSGTSFAAPHVAGAMALLLSAFPGTAVADLEEAIARSAVDLGAAGPDNVYGNGLVDAAGAYQRLLRPSRIGVFRKGSWYLDLDGSRSWSAASDITIASFGLPTDLPVTGDMNGDGFTEVGVFRRGRWFFDLDDSGTWSGCRESGGSDLCLPLFGAPNDIPVTGDWNGDGTTEVGVYRRGQWFFDSDGSGTWSADKDASNPGFGAPGDVPVTGDWNGDGVTEIGTYRRGTWYLDYNGNGRWDGVSGGDRVCTFGAADDIPVTLDGDGDGKTDIAVYRPANRTWYLDDGSGQWEAGTDVVIASFGAQMDKPVTGIWR
jgi:subtilisin family serine protease